MELTNGGAVLPSEFVAPGHCRMFRMIGATMSIQPIMPGASTPPAL